MEENTIMIAEDNMMFVEESSIVDENNVVGESYPIEENQITEEVTTTEENDVVEEVPTMTIAECQVETYKHIENVRRYIKFFTDRLTTRGIEHDRLKLKSPEVEIFTEYTPKLANVTYDSDEYNDCLKEMDVALQHHYANYRHHPEHFAKGINDMNLIDIVEMLCDWQASSMRQHDGNLLKSIDTNAQRFGINGQLKQIFINTAKLFDEQN